jgi:hypothetical protein
MLHQATINFWRRFVNQTRELDCREAAQFNQPLQATAATPRN